MKLKPHMGEVVLAALGKCLTKQLKEEGLIVASEAPSMAGGCVHSVGLRGGADF